LQIHVHTSLYSGVLKKHPERANDSKEERIFKAVATVTLDFEIKPVIQLWEASTYRSGSG